MALSASDPENQLKNQIAIITLAKQSQSINDFALSYKKSLQSGEILGPDSIFNKYVKTERQVPSGKQKYIGFGRYEPEMVTEKVYYTDAEIMSMPPAQIDKMFMGGQPRGYNPGAMSTWGPYEENQTNGIPQLGGYTTFLDGLSKGTFSDAYNKIKESSPEMLTEEVKSSFEAAGKKVGRRGLGALIPGLIQSGVMAGFGVGITGLFSGAGAAAVANPSSISGVIANNAANFTANGALTGAGTAAGSVLSPSGGITTLGGAGQGAVPTAAGITLPSGTAIPLAANPFTSGVATGSIGAGGAGGISTAAGAPGSPSILSSVANKAVSNADDIISAVGGDSDTTNNTTGSTSPAAGAAAGVLAAGAAAAAGSDNSNVAPVSATRTGGLLSQAGGTSGTTGSTTSTNTSNGINWTGGVNFHAAEQGNSDSTNASKVMRGLF